MNMEKDLKEYQIKLKKLDKVLKEREMRDDRVGSASTSGEWLWCKAARILGSDMSSHVSMF